MPFDAGCHQLKIFFSVRCFLLYSYGSIFGWLVDCPYKEICFHIYTDPHNMLTRVQSSKCYQTSFMLLL